MIIRCPKCHFSQPEDQYCARCGVNMATYRPPSTPILKKILNNIFFQLIAVIGLGALTVVWILQRQQAGGLTAVNGFSAHKIRSTAFVGESSNATPDLETMAAAEALTSSDPSLATTLAGAAPASEIGTETVATDPGTTTTTTLAGGKAVAGNPVPLANPKQVKITYGEVTDRGFEILTEESRSSGQYNSFADYAAGVIPNVAKKLTQVTRDFKVVHTETIEVQSGKPLQVNLDYRDRNREPASAEMQIATNVHLENADGATRAEIEVLRSAKGTDRANYPANFDVMSDTGYFISGFHHGKSSQEAERTLESELVVLVEFLR